MQKFTFKEKVLQIRAFKNEKLSNDLKASTSLKCEFNKTIEENEKLSKEILELKNSILSFTKVKTLLTSLNFYSACCLFLVLIVVLS